MQLPIEFNFEKPEESNGFLLWQLTMIWQRKMKRGLEEVDLTHTQFALLAALAWLLKNNKTVTQVDIANHSNTDRMMVSKVLRTLQDKKYILRQEHETDTRAKSISLTKSGQESLQKALKIVSSVDSEFFSVLKAEEKAFNSNMQLLISKNSEIV